MPLDKVWPRDLPEVTLESILKTEIRGDQRRISSGRSKTFKMNLKKVGRCECSFLEISKVPMHPFHMTSSRGHTLGVITCNNTIQNIMGSGGAPLYINSCGKYKRRPERTPPHGTYQGPCFVSNYVEKYRTHPQRTRPYLDSFQGPCFVSYCVEKYRTHPERTRPYDTYQGTCVVSCFVWKNAERTHDAPVHMSPLACAQGQEDVAQADHGDSRLRHGGEL